MPHSRIHSPFCSILLLLSCILVSVPLLMAAVEERTVIATGESAVTGSTPESLLLARDEAIHRAQRRAIEETVGVFVDAETIVKNFRLLEDKIFTSVSGYITDYTVINDNKGVQGLYRVSIRATIATGPLQQKLRALNIIRTRKGNPRLMILMKDFFETPSGENELKKGERLAQAVIEKEFLSLNFPLVDSAQMNAVRERDERVAFDDPAGAAALAKRHGAEVIIVGEATASQMTRTTSFGVEVFHCDAHASARAIQADTSRVIASENASSGRIVKGGRAAAAREALSVAARKLATALSDSIIESWRSEVFNTATVQIVASGANSKLRRLFKKNLNAMRSVKRADERSWTKGVLVLEVEIDGAVWKDFEQRLEGLPSLTVEPTGKTQNRIDITLKEKL